MAGHEVGVEVGADRDDHVDVGVVYQGGERVLELTSVGDRGGIQLLELIDDEQQRAPAWRRPPSPGGQAQLGHGVAANAQCLDVPTLATVEPVVPQPGGHAGEGQ